MTVKITKPEINVREKLSELDKPSGITGEAVLRAGTTAEARKAVELSNVADSATGVSVTGTIASGAITATSLAVDNFTLDGTTLALSSGDMTLDVAGDIILDADGGDFKFRDGGAGFFTISNSSLDAVLTVGQQNEDFIVKGYDGASLITALTLDMSEAGEATFNGDIKLNDGKVARFGTDQDFRIGFDGTNAVLQNVTSDSDITFLGKDGASTITALTLDMSAAGAATFASSVVATNFNFSTAPNYAGLSLGVYNSGTWLNTPANTTGFLGVAGSGMVSWYTSGVGLAGAVTINEAGIDADFRVESDGNANMLFVDGGANKVGVGTNAPARTLSIWDTVNGYNLELQQRSAYNSGNQSGVVFSAKFHSDGSTTDLASIRGGKDNTTDGDYGGKVAIWTRPNGGSDTAVATWDSQGGFTTRPRGAGNTVFNEDGVDSDFRVESNSYSHMLFVDAGNNGIGIANSSVEYQLDVGADGIAHAGGKTMRINSSGDTIFSLSRAGTSLFSMRNNGTSYTALSSNSGADLLLGYSTSGAGAIVDHLRFRAASTVFNEDGVDRDFRIESNDNANMLFVDGGNNRVGIGRVPTTHALEVESHADFKSNMSVAGGITAGGAITSTGTITATGGTLPSVPTNSTASYTLVLGDAGQTRRFTGSTSSKVCTIPSNASVAYPLGTLICIINDGTYNITVEITSDTMTWAKDNSTGSRTLLAGGELIIHKTTATTWKCNGSALVT